MKPVEHWDPNFDGDVDGFEEGKEGIVGRSSSFSRSFRILRESTSSRSSFLAADYCIAIATNATQRSIQVRPDFEMM
jgi:hypothetical protein